ncbi:MAG: hypothetical protein DRQ39_10015 [Gammaproteobacteria bacterium]|nr:MAG: hypothetical protein DRQ39_10015 [Gammaproteobacteria bacterium]
MWNAAYPDPEGIKESNEPCGSLPVGLIPGMFDREDRYPDRRGDVAAGNHCADVHRNGVGFASADAP